MITGASGFIGSNVAKYLRAEGHEIWQVSYSAKLNENCSKIIKWENLTEFTPNTDRNIIVIHAGALSSYLNNNKKKMQEGNVKRTELIGKWCEKNKCKLIHLSTIGIYDRPRFKKIESRLALSSPKTPKSTYGTSKLHAEEKIENSKDLEYTIIRLPWVYGVDMRSNSHLRVFAKWQNSKKLISRISWPGKVTVVHINSVCEIIHKIVKGDIASKNNIILPGEKTPISIRNILSQEKALKIDYKIIRAMARFLPFNMRILLEEALVYENPLDTGNHQFLSEIAEFKAEWQV